MRFTIRELLMLMVVIAVWLGLVLPALNQGRETARRMSCQNNLKQYGLAILNYESTYRRLPCAMGGTEGSPMVSNAGSISGLIGLMPYIEASPWYDQLMTAAVPGGPAPWIAPNKAFDFWEKQYHMLLCPSDGSRDRRDGQVAGEYAKTNYAFCWGDGVASILDKPTTFPLTRGPFQVHANKKIGDVTDGISNTVAIGEIALRSRDRKLSEIAIVPGIEQNPSLCLKQLGASGFVSGTRFVNTRERRTGRWCDGRPYYTGFTTVLPPNTISCTPVDSDASWGVFSTSSHHRGVVQLAMLDGSTRTINNNIDCGILSTIPPDAAQRSELTMISPYGVWGTLGTINSSDNVTTPE